MQNKIVLFYGFAPLADPTAVMLWQRALAERHGLRGRIIVSPHGINATVGGPIDAVKQYVRTTREHPAFAQIAVKWSDGSAEDFPRLSVKVRPELVTFGVPEEVRVDDQGVIGGGTHLSPDALHRLMEDRDDVVMFDGRNSREAQIGRFKDAVVPRAETTRDLVEQLDSGAFDHLKDSPVVTYCTGGIRCEVLSTLMRNRGFEEVYQLDGGIVTYGEAYGNEGLWEGSLYVFDRRMHLEFGSGAESLGECTVCGQRTPLFANCADLSCRTLRLVCESCQATPAGQCCAEHPALV